MREYCKSPQNHNLFDVKFLSILQNDTPRCASASEIFFQQSRSSNREISASLQSAPSSTLLDHTPQLAPEQPANHLPAPNLVSMSAAVTIAFQTPLPIRAHRSSAKRTHLSPVVASASPRTALAALSAAALVALTPATADAVSGGGKDYSSQTWNGETFHGSYIGKDFSGGLFRGCDFVGSDLSNSRFFKAELRDADMTGVNLSFATIEGAIVKDTVFTNAIMISSYISSSIVDAGSIEGVDFTDALIVPNSTIVRLCQRPDATGVNPTTGVSTRDSLMCAD